MKMLGSSVLPDLEETMNSVLPISTACSIALICAGSVLSSMWKRGQLACCPNVLLNTSGPRLDPPIPSSTRSVNPPCFTSFAKAVSRSISASSCSTMFSQPSHLSSSVPAHNDVSPAQSRRIRPPARQTSISASKAAFISGEPSPISMQARSPSRSARRCRAMAPNSLSNESANCCTPSVTSSSVTSFSEMPRRSSSASTARARYVLLDDVGCRLTVFAECIHRRRRDGVHGVAADQRLDIHRVLVGGAFRAGGRPKQTLCLRTHHGQTLPARSGELRFVANVGEFGVGDCGVAAQSVLHPFVAELVQPFVDRDIDAANKNAGDATNL